MPTPIKGHRQRQAQLVDWIKATPTVAGVVLTLAAGERVHTFRLTADQLAALQASTLTSPEAGDSIAQPTRAGGPDRWPR